MSNFVLVDLETQSAVDLRKVGSQAYLKDKSTRLMSAVFLAERLMVVWVPRSRLPMSDKPIDGELRADGCEIMYWTGEIVPPIIDKLIRNGAVFVAHNADNFDRLAWEILVGGPQPDWYDTIHACRANGLPAGLDRASRALGGEGKDDRGSRAMHLLCKAKYTAGEVKYPVGTPELWKQLLQYNVIDVLELKRVFEHTGVTEPELLKVHQKINARGIPVDLALARKLRDLWTELGEQARDEVAKLTNGELKEQDLNSPAKVKNWLARKGFPVASLARAQIEQMIADPDGFFGDADDETAALVHQVLLARQQSVRTAPGKLDRILGSAGEGYRVRNCFVYYGAHTGRWSARELQPHNFPRGLNGLDVGELLRLHAARGLQLTDVRQAAAMVGGSTADALGTLMRPVIRAPKGRRLVICDYASVEARCVAWLARDGAMLGAFTGRDIYCEMASTIFGRTVTKANKTERQVGKNTVLGCGYQMGAKKFAASAALQGCNLEAAGVTGEQCVKAFREQFPSVPRMWKAYDVAFRHAIDRGNKTACRCLFLREGDDIIIRLPSGRELRYRDVKMEMLTPVWGGEPRPTPTYYSPRGYRKTVYGGYLTENISQATCRDLLAHAMMSLDSLDWNVVMHVHDELVLEVKECDQFLALRDMLKVMSTPPEWASGFPLAVEGFVSEHYVKNPLPGYPHGKGELGKVTLEGI
jgi:DNA polymerase